MAIVLISNSTNTRITDGSTTESSHVATIQILDLAKNIYTYSHYPKTRTAPLILLGVLCDRVQLNMSTFLRALSF